MKKYIFSGTLTISVYTIVEAESLKDALAMAKERDNMMIIHDGSNNANECWMVDELDGDIYDIEREE